LKKVEKQSGFDRHSDLSDEEGNDKDFQHLIRRLGQSHSRFAISETALFHLRLSIDTLRRQLQIMDNTLPEPCKQTLSRSSMELKQRIEYMSSSIEHAIIYGNFRTRLQAQQGVVSSIFLFKLNAAYVLAD